MKKLTKSQVRALTMARDRGHAFAEIGVHERVGGSYRRMVVRLSAAGLLTQNAPFNITLKGREALAKLGGAE